MVTKITIPEMVKGGDITTSGDLDYEGADRRIKNCGQLTAAEVT